MPPDHRQTSAPTQPFRTQVISRLGSQRYGTVLLARPFSYTLLTMLFVAITAGLISFFVFFSVMRKAQVSGVLLPAQGLIRIQPNQGGVVVVRNVREGQTVRAGDVLFVLSHERPNTDLGSAERTISSLLQSRRNSLRSELNQLQQQSSQRASEYQRRANDLQAEIGRIEAQILLQQRRVSLAEATVGRYNDLLASHYMSLAQVQEKQADLLDQQQRLADLTRAKASVARELAAAQYELTDVRIQSRRDDELGGRNISALEQDLAENEARRQTLLRAAKDGVVTAITGEPGQTVSAGQAIAALLPSDSELDAELYVPSRSAGFLKPGMNVLLRYQAYSYQKFGQYNGTVREVSSTAMRADELALAGTAMLVGAAAEPLYRVRVKLERQTVQAYGKEYPLKSGAELDASIILERRRLYEWVLDPLYTVIGRI